MSVRVVIVDDEPLAIKVIENYVLQMKQLVLAATFTSAVDAMEFLRKNDIDIVFLDINMPMLNGMDFLKGVGAKPFAVMTTAHEDYALESFNLHAIDYLVKPIAFPVFLRSVHRILEFLGRSGEKDSSLATKPSIFVKVSKKRLQRIYLEDILVVESMKDYINIKTLLGDFMAHQSLSSFTEALPKHAFQRIHRSYTIALEKVKAVSATSLEIAGQSYPIGRQYAKEVRRILLNEK